MDLGWATVRGRARWATLLGVVVALALIGGSLIALDRSVLSFNGWSSGPATGIEQQTLPPAPEGALNIGSSRGTAAPLGGIPGAAGTPLAPVLPATGGGAGAAVGTPGGTAGGGTTGGLFGGTGGTGAPGAAGGLDVSPPTAGAPSTGSTQPVGVPRQADSDADGIPNVTERAAGTNPAVADTDGDGLPDGWERDNGLNPRDGADGSLDSDGDGLRNVTEFRVGDDPRATDSNHDGVIDSADDTDRDGLPNAAEQQLDLDPTNGDSSGTGVADGSADTDGDGIPNAVEIGLGLDPSTGETAPGAPDGDRRFGWRRGAQQRGDHDGHLAVRRRQQRRWGAGRVGGPRRRRDADRE